MSEQKQRSGPLSRFSVVDLARVRAGPTCVRQLADWGADVIKIESPPALKISDGWAATASDRVSRTCIATSALSR